jgi:hypothetical protein
MPRYFFHIKSQRTGGSKTRKAQISMFSTPQSRKPQRRFGS